MYLTVVYNRAHCTWKNLLRSMLWAFQTGRYLSLDSLAVSMRPILDRTTFGVLNRVSRQCLSVWRYKLRGSYNDWVGKGGHMSEFLRIYRTSRNREKSVWPSQRNVEPAYLWPHPITNMVIQPLTYVTSRPIPSIGLKQVYPLDWVPLMINSRIRQAYVD